MIEKRLPKYIFGNEDIRKQVADILKRPWQTSQRQWFFIDQEMMDNEHDDRGYILQTSTWPGMPIQRDGQGIPEVPYCQGDMTIMGKIETAIRTGRMERGECAEIMSCMFGAEHAGLFDRAFDAVESVTSVDEASLKLKF